MITDAPDIYPVYVDESYGQHHPYLCVAGYVFEPAKAKELSVEWASILASKALPYFHMAACNGGYDEFSHLDESECDLVARQMIGLTRDHAEYGFGVALDPIAYEKAFTGQVRVVAGAPYTFCLRECLTMTRRWAERVNFGGRFAFFFEKGHPHAGEAEQVIASYGTNGLAERFRYFSSTFISKEDAEPLQAADILAWHTYTAFKRQAAGRDPRKDLVALLREQDMVLELTAPILMEMAAELGKRLSSASFSSGEGASGAMP